MNVGRNRYAQPFAKEFLNIFFKVFFLPMPLVTEKITCKAISLKQDTTTAAVNLSGNRSPCFWAKSTLSCAKESDLYKKTCLHLYLNERRFHCFKSKTPLNSVGLRPTPKPSLSANILNNDYNSLLQLVYWMN